ncbi:MAG: [FeFe] hydrogenase H-cluster radical SAM maturase HydG [Desulfobacteraceae bacterium]|jgi:2-iminoacetate synthase
MIYINETKINDLLDSEKDPDYEKFDAILKKAKGLNRLSLAETALLLNTEDPERLEKIYITAREVKEEIYGKRLVLFAPLYVSNLCRNKCLYCAFRADNNLLKRISLSAPEIQRQVEYLLKRGHMRILLVAGESQVKGKKPVEYYCECIRAIYGVSSGPHHIKRVNINCAPLNVDEFRMLKSTGIGTYQVFQETYHEETYGKVHVSGPKSDPDNRIDAIDRAFEAGIDDVGIGPLFGLYDYRFEALGLLMHIEHLEEKFGVGPHTISMPRIEPALGSDLSNNVPYRVSDEDFKKLVAILRLSVPYTGMILSTRESPEMRNDLFNLGISQISAESQTIPGGYTDRDDTDIGSQFTLMDHRSLDEIICRLIQDGFIPSFCAACYRKERTGKKFMSLAKPGLIKKQCRLNALITLREYLDDFASEKVRNTGYAFIEQQKNILSGAELNILEEFYDAVDAGKRDNYM